MNNLSTNTRKTALHQYARQKGYTNAVTSSLLTTGVLVPLLFYNRSDFIDNPTNRLQNTEYLQPQPVSFVSISERVKAIDDQLDMPRKLLAEIMGISRTTLYDLLNGIERDFRSEARLVEVEQAAKVIRKTMTYPLGRSALTIKVDDESMGDILKAPSIDDFKVAKIASVIQRRKEAEHGKKSDLEAQLRQQTLISSTD